MISKLKYFIFYFTLIISSFSCTNQIKVDDRIEQDFNFSSIYYIQLNKNKESGLSLLEGNIKLTNSKLIISINDGLNSDKESFNIRTVTYDDDPNKILYRTNNGDFDIELQNDTIKKVFWVSNYSTTIFNKQKPEILIIKPLPSPLKGCNENEQRLSLWDYDGFAIGSIDMASSLEIKGSLYQYTTVEKPPVLTLQPKGINDEELSALNSYMRILYETIQGENGEFNKINEVIQFNDIELDLINDTFKNEFTDDFSRNNLKLIKWNPIEVVELNNMSALKISYTRQWNYEPKVKVEIYKIFNYNKRHSLTISYRETEMLKWEKAIEVAKNSFRIIKAN